VKPTIKDIAKEAGVSIATVSHVINKTRYVSPDLIKKVDLAIKKLGYKSRTGDWNYFKNKTIGILIPDISCNYFTEIAKYIESFLQNESYDLVTYSYNNNKDRELSYLNRLLFKDKVDGVILAPYKLDKNDLKPLKDSKIPFVFIGNIIEGLKANAVLSDNAESVYLATTHLIKYGHEAISLIFWKKEKTLIEEELQSYKRAFSEYGIAYNKDLVLYTEKEDDLKETFEKYFNIENKPTAVICTNTKLTIFILKFLFDNQIECPKDISVVGLDIYGFEDIYNPPLTSISNFPDKIGLSAIEILLNATKVKKIEPIIKKVSISLNVRKSTQIIGRGPFGEKSEYPDVLVLSESEIKKIQKGNYNAALSFHYKGKLWMKLTELGIKDTFYKLGIKLIAITDAHFDPNLQCIQLDSLLSQKPSIIISIPTDEIKTALNYKKIVDSDTKLVLIDNVPNGLKHGDYVTCVSVNEHENGYNAGKLLGSYFKNHKKVKIGLIVHEAPFFATKQRDSSAEQALNEEFENIEIVAKASFVKEERVSNICRSMISTFPDIQGLYISWDGPAINAMDVLTDLGREDIAIITCDLDIEVALSMAKEGMIKGISSQRPYEQGVAMANAAANALIGKSVPPFIGVKPYIVTRNNLLKAWKDIIKEKEPDQLVEIYEQNI